MIECVPGGATGVHEDGNLGGAYRRHSASSSPIRSYKLFSVHDHEFIVHLVMLLRCTLSIYFYTSFILVYTLSVVLDTYDFRYKRFAERFLKCLLVAASYKTQKKGYLYGYQPPLPFSALLRLLHLEPLETLHIFTQKTIKMEISPDRSNGWTRLLGNLQHPTHRFHENILMTLLQQQLIPLLLQNRKGKEDGNCCSRTRSMQSTTTNPTTTTYGIHGMLLLFCFVFSFAGCFPQIRQGLRSTSRHVAPTLVVNMARLSVASRCAMEGWSEGGIVRA